MLTRTTSREMERLRKAIEDRVDQMMRREGHMIESRKWSVPSGLPALSRDNNPVFTDRTTLPLEGTFQAITDIMSSG